jgi:alpha-tubulin suppressor-like RCC1 family protein
MSVRRIWSRAVAVLVVLGIAWIVATVAVAAAPRAKVSGAVSGSLTGADSAKSGFSADSGSGALRSATVTATAIAAGFGHSCALTRAGSVECWGWNRDGQLGDGTTSDRLTPVDVSGLRSGVTAIAAGGTHTCALMGTGGVKCWGNNEAGQLGDGTTSDRSTPVDVSGLSGGVTAIAAGGADSCALVSSGAVKCWGWNGYGQLGDGTTSGRLTPVDVAGLGGRATAIAAGGNDSCALMSTGRVKCWGWDYYGQLGDGRPAFQQSTPVEVSGLSGGVVAIALGEYHTCAVTDAGTAKCWGWNHYGQVSGEATSHDELTPVDVEGLGDHVTAISPAGIETSALTGTGSVEDWGGLEPRVTPIDIVGVTAIADGGGHVCAVIRSGGVRCWGGNPYGELGDGTTTFSGLTPVTVVGFGPAKATLAILSRSVTVSAARAAGVRLRCSGHARCQGAITLTASVSGKLVGSSARRVQVELGSRTFSIAASRTQTIDVRLTGRGFMLLVRVKRLPTRIRVAYQQPAGGTTTAIRNVTLTAPTLIRARSSRALASHRIPTPHV